MKGRSALHDGLYQLLERVESDERAAEQEAFDARHAASDKAHEERCAEELEIQRRTMRALESIAENLSLARAHGELRCHCKR